MSIKRKITSSLFVLGLVVVLSACGKNPTPQADNAQGTSAPSSAKMNTAPSESEKLPAPTGEVDDIVTSALDGSNVESAEAAKEEDAAFSAIEDSEETDDFSRSYDENEL